VPAVDGRTLVTVQIDKGSPMPTTLVSLTLLALFAPPLETSETPTTRLYIRTVPTANVQLDGQPLGKSGGLFIVPPGVRRITVELDDHYPQHQQIEIRSGQITRLQLDLQPKAGPRQATAKSSAAAVPPAFRMPDNAVPLSYVGERSDRRRSLGGTGYAVAFRSPKGSHRVVAIEFYGSRYGTPEPPAEDFDVYLLNKDRKVLQRLSYPYSLVEQGKARWYTLPISPAVEVPAQFYVVLSFSAHEKKGVYIGVDRTVKTSHSFMGLPTETFDPVPECYDWMVRTYLVPAAATKD
jgi:hypothetical protein